jgi:hypothetical protein
VVVLRSRDHSVAEAASPGLGRRELTSGRSSSSAIKVALFFLALFYSSTPTHVRR